MIIGLQWALVQIMRTVSWPFCCFKFANFRWFRVICHPNAPVAAGTRLTERLLEPTYLPSLVTTTVWLQSPCSHPALTLRSPYSAGAQNEAFWWWNLDNHGTHALFGRSSQNLWRRAMNKWPVMNKRQFANIHLTTFTQWLTESFTDCSFATFAWIISRWISGIINE